MVHDFGGYGQLASFFWSMMRQNVGAEGLHKTEVPHSSRKGEKQIKFSAKNVLDSFLHPPMSAPPYFLPPPSKAKDPVFIIDEVRALMK